MLLRSVLSRRARAAAVVGSIAALTSFGLATGTAADADVATGALVAGVVTGADGSPSAGATVSLVVWPTPAYIGAMASGTAIPTLTLATTRAATDGSYRLAPSLNGLAAKYVQPQGSVNAEVDVTTKSQLLQSFGIRAAVPGSAAATGTDNSLAVPGSVADAVNFNLKAGAVTEAVGAAAASSYSAPTSASAVGSSAVTAKATDATDTDVIAPDSSIPPTVGCGQWINGKKYPARDETFMNIYTFGNAALDMEIGTSHKLGYGFKITGGGWSAGGTTTLESSTSLGAQANFTKNVQLQNQVNYRHVYAQCWTSRGVSYYQHKVVATGIAYLLTGEKKIDPRAWGSCRTYSSASYAGKKFSKGTGANQTFSKGVDAPYLSLSAEVAYSKNIDVTWTIPYGGENLCGSTAEGFGASPFGGATPINVGCPHTTVDVSDVADGSEAETDSTPDC